MRQLGAVVAVLAFAGLASGAAYWGGIRDGRAGERSQTYALEAKARADSIRIADLVKVATARELAEQTRRRDSAAAAQLAKRQRFRITSDTTIVVVGDSLPQLAPAPLIAYVRGQDAKVAIDSAWLAKLAADTVATARQRDLWMARALAAERELERVKAPRFGLKTGILIGVSATLAIAKAVAEVVR